MGRLTSACRLPRRTHPILECAIPARKPRPRKPPPPADPPPPAAVADPPPGRQAAGIDAGDRTHWACVGHTPDGGETAREFPAHTPGLRQLVAWLKACDVTTVAVEETGAYAHVLFLTLLEAGFEVLMAPPHFAKQVKGRPKTDRLDCQWIRRLHHHGLLPSVFQPDDATQTLRDYVRQRANLVRLSAQHVQRMQKALQLMNLKLTAVLGDVTGVTGLKFIRAIVAGERDPHALARLRDRRCRHSAADVATALDGRYRPEHVVELRLSLRMWEHYLAAVADLDAVIDSQLRATRSERGPGRGGGGGGWLNPARPAVSISGDEEHPPPPAATSRSGHVITRRSQNMCVTLTAARPGPAAGEAFAAALPRVEAVARFATRRVPCPDARDELAAEAVALAWRTYVALLRRGKDPAGFVTTLARRAAQAALAGRRVCGAEKVRDALSPLARLRGRVTLERLGDRRRDRRRRPGEVVAAELTAADPRVRVPDQAAFRVDFPRFRGRLTPASRSALDLLAAGWGTGAAAARLGVTPARVSQLRRELAEKWQAFHDGPA